MKIVNLGCPLYCEGETCVDLNPKDSRVMKMDVTLYLLSCASLGPKIDVIRSKNMLEHMTEIDSLFSLMHDALSTNGRIEIITDNAEFLPFYFPFIHRWGVGAHSSNKYLENYKYKNCVPHYALFTKLHLSNIATKYHFQILELKRITLGARLKCVAVKA